jgi:NAD(P)H dehydrogenase (quinone)
MKSLSLEYALTIFLVTGATGRLGTAVIRGLLAQISVADLRVLVRGSADAATFSTRGLTPCLGDYSDRASLIKAFAGVDRVIFISSPVLDPTVRAAQHRAVVRAAAEAGVQHVVYTSAMGAQYDPGHSAAEASLVESGINHTILRNALYTDPFVAKSIDEARAGTIRSASGGHAIVTASIADLGEGAARAAVHPPKRELWELRGPSWTFDELACALSELSGRHVIHKEVDDSETGQFAGLFPLIRRNLFSAETQDLSDLLGRHPQGIAEVVAAQVGRSFPKS